MLLSLVLASLLALARAAPLKVVIMAGQSNMQGHGYVDHHGGDIPKSNPGTLEQLVKSNPKEYGKLKSGNSWVSRKDVWVYYNDKGSFNPNAWEIGPELGF